MPVSAFSGWRASPPPPEALTSLFSRVLVEEARHIVFFVNWIAWDRTRRGLRGPLMQAIPALRRTSRRSAAEFKDGTRIQTEKGPADGADLFGDLLKDLTAAKFVRACVEENEPIHGLVRPEADPPARHSRAGSSCTHRHRGDRPHSRGISEVGVALDRLT